MHALITIESLRSAASQRSHTHRNLRQHLIVLVRKITHFNLAILHPSLTPVELVSQHILLILHHAKHPLTAEQLIEQLHVSTTVVHAAVKLLYTEQTIIPYTETGAPQSPALAITLTGRIRAQQLTSWTDLLLRFIPEATPHALKDLHQSLLACLGRRHHSIAVHTLCVTCRNFTPFQYPYDSIKPHHCHLLNQPLLDTSLRTSCSEHQISANS